MPSFSESWHDLSAISSVNHVAVLEPRVPWTDSDHLLLDCSVARLRQFLLIVCAKHDEEPDGEVYKPTNTGHLLDSEQKLQSETEVENATAFLLLVGKVNGPKLIQGFFFHIILVFREQILGYRMKGAILSFKQALLTLRVSERTIFYFQIIKL